MLEIGPGRGDMTTAIAEKCKVVAVEIDKDLIPHLKEKYKNTPNVTIVHGDILEADFSKLIPEKSKVIANIPYYISTPIIFKILENKKYFTTAVMTVQKELADRIVAGHGNKEYGVLTVMVQLHADVVVTQHLPAAAFKPAPEVDSSVIKLTIHQKPKYGELDFPHFEKIVRTGFQQRRKMLRGTLQQLGYTKEELEKVLNNCGIKTEARPEEVSIAGLAELARKLKNLKR